MDVMEHVQLSDLILIQKTESLFINKGGAQIDTILIGLTNTRQVDFNDVLVFFLLYPSKVQEIEGGSNHFFHFWTLSSETPMET